MTLMRVLLKSLSEQYVVTVHSAWQLIVTTSLLVTASVSYRTSTASRAGKSVRKQPSTLSVSAEVAFVSLLLQYTR